MSVIEDHDEFKKRTALMLDYFNQNKIPHILIEVKHDHMESDTSPITELANLFQMIVNSLIGDVIVSHNDQATILLDHLKASLESQIFLMSNLMAERLPLLADDANESMEEEVVDMPEVFKEALEEILDVEEKEGEAF